MESLIAGLVASDGHLDKDGCGIRIITKDKNFADLISSLLNKITGKNSSIYLGKSGYGKVKYTIYVYDSKSWKKFVEKYKIPFGKKASIIKPPINLSSKNQILYLKGWFAGEGCVSRDVHHKDKRIFVYPQIEFWVKNRQIAEWAFDLLSKLDIFSRKYYINKKEQWLIMIRKKDSIKNFKEKIGFFHPEKSKKFDKLLGHPRIRTSSL